jgi:hypothetical protein
MKRLGWDTHRNAVRVLLANTLSLRLALLERVLILELRTRHGFRCYRVVRVLFWYEMQPL